MSSFMSAWRRLSLVMCVAAAGCGGGDAALDGDAPRDASGIGRDATADAGASDAGASDAGASDAGASDAGASDAGASDAGASDAGLAPDGGLACATDCSELSDACNEGACDPSSGECVRRPTAAGACGDPSDTECDDPDACDDAGACIANHVSAGTACGDGSDTDCSDPDSCDGAGACLANHSPAGAACGDPLVTDCNAADGCDGAGACAARLAADGAACDDCPAGPGACDACSTGSCVDRCGNGVIDAGEACELSSDGSCPGRCRADCSCNPPVSCDAIWMSDPTSADGSYWIDPDGIGGAAPWLATCDMDATGGWTRVAFEDFGAPTSGWSTTNTITTCGSYGAILGGVDVIAGGTNAKTYSWSAVPHASARVTLEFIKIDGWDGELATVTLAGTSIWSSRFCFCVQGCVGYCDGGAQECGQLFGGWTERDVVIDGSTAHTGDSIVLEVSTALDQSPSDESWGIDDVAIWVR